LERRCTVDAGTYVFTGQGEDDLIDRRAVDLKPLLTGCFSLDEVQTAFELAGDRSRSMKAQLSF
ncbi:MAG: hypothetical protein JO161_10880, partial [Planctomycetaceae bacterium]|nr:hypothetical protein [Planctomycetaceae bacterium]